MQKDRHALALFPGFLLTGGSKLFSDGILAIEVSGHGFESLKGFFISSGGRAEGPRLPELSPSRE